MLVSDKIGRLRYVESIDIHVCTHSLEKNIQFAASKWKRRNWKAETESGNDSRYCQCACTRGVMCVASFVPGPKPSASIFSLPRDKAICIDANNIGANVIKITGIRLR